MPSDKAGPGKRINARSIAWVLTAVLLLTVFWGWRQGWFERTPSLRPPQVVTIYCYSTLDRVMNNALFPAFRDLWQREQGQVVEFVATFAGSGDLTDRIIKKYPAQIAIVSSELDAYRLPIRWQSWLELPHRGILAHTPLIIVTREDNPGGIHDFEDLTRPDVRIIHGDPLTSGGAALAILAEYFSALQHRGEKDAAYQQLVGVWKNVTARAASAREARLRFERGEGNALITYEQDAVAVPGAERIRGEIIYPPVSLVAQPIVVRIENNIAQWERQLIDAFVQYLWSREAQQMLVDYGFRSVYPELDASNRQLGTIGNPITLESLGKPADVRRDILEALWREQVLPGLPQ